MIPCIVCTSDNIIDEEHICENFGLVDKVIHEHGFPKIVIACIFDLRHGNRGSTSLMCRAMA